MNWIESIACYKYSRPLSIPEQDRVKISVLQKPFEEVIYNRMLRLSYENARNYCRISYSTIQETTSLRSKNAVITGIQGLIEKRHIIKLCNDEGKPEMNREGTLYRVLSPIEALRGVLDDGMVVAEINRDGMAFTMAEKKLPGIESGTPKDIPRDSHTIDYTRSGNIHKHHSSRLKWGFAVLSTSFLLVMILAGIVLLIFNYHFRNPSFSDRIQQGSRKNSLPVNRSSIQDKSMDSIGQRNQAEDSSSGHQGTAYGPVADELSPLERGSSTLQMNNNGYMDETSIESVQVSINDIKKDDQYQNASSSKILVNNISEQKKQVDNIKTADKETINLMQKKKNEGAKQGQGTKKLNTKMPNVAKTEKTQLNKGNSVKMTADKNQTIVDTPEEKPLTIIE